LQPDFLLEKKTFLSDPDAVDRITLKKPDDFHVHLRDGAPLAAYAAESARWFGRALVMPNIKPAVTDARSLTAYRERILQAVSGWQPLMTFKVVPGQTREVIKDLRDAGAIAGKYYPAGVTTNSEGGAADWESCAVAIGHLEAEGLTLCVHGELPGTAPWDSERAFLPILGEIVSAFPKLRIVLEHVSTAEAVDFLAAQDPRRLAGTVTVHHLLYSAADLWSPRFSSHYYCKPIIQGNRDRSALQEWVLSGACNCFFGSDSAPHPRENKENASANPGIFSSPVAIPLLADFFSDRGDISTMEKFLSENGARFYGLPLTAEKLTLVLGTRPVSGLIGGAVPLLAGETVNWSPA
jgi:dihydroorotase